MVRSSSSIGCAYSYAGTLSARPWCTASLPESRSISGRMTSSTGMLRVVASLRTSLTRSSISMRVATYSAEAGILARSASSTELRPVTTSNSASDLALRVEEPPPPVLPVPVLRPVRGAPEPEPPGARLRPPPAAAKRSLAALALPAGWYGRSSALGVGFLPSRAWRPCPPEPTWGPLLPLRTAPVRDLRSVFFISQNSNVHPTGCLRWLCRRRRARPGYGLRPRSRGWSLRSRDRRAVARRGR
jgi:hypothetical protein